MVTLDIRWAQLRVHCNYNTGPLSPSVRFGPTAFATRTLTQNRFCLSSVLHSHGRYIPGALMENGFSSIDMLHALVG